MELNTARLNTSMTSLSTKTAELGGYVQTLELNIIELQKLIKGPHVSVSIPQHGNENIQGAVKLPDKPSEEQNKEKLRMSIEFKDANMSQLLDDMTEDPDAPFVILTESPLRDTSLLDLER